MKHLSYLVIIVTILMLSCSTVMAKSVTVSGTGRTATEAENDAMRNAVENVMGTLVDSNTLVNNAVVISDQIYTKSRGFITNYSVRNKEQTPSGWLVTIDADVDDNPNSQLMSELTRLGIIDNSLRNPKIVVYIPEHHIQYRVPDPAGETAVIKAFIDAGFTNMIEGSPVLQTSSAKSDWQSKPYKSLNIEDLRSASRFFSADILIIGEAFSEGVGDAAQFLPGIQSSGMHSCRARLEAKMYIAKTGQIIAADGAYGSGMDISQAIASKMALASAGKQMGEYLVNQTLNIGSGNRQNIELIVVGADFSKVNSVKMALGSIRGVKDVQISSYDNGKGVFTMHYSGSPQTLFNEIQGNINLNIVMQSMAYNTLTIRVY